MLLRTLISVECGLPLDQTIVLRHSRPAAKLLQSGSKAFERYQSLQLPKDDRFRVPYWVSFVSTGREEAVLVGVYRTEFRGRYQPTQEDLAGRIVGRLDEHDEYETVRTDLLDSLRGRLHIDWGPDVSGWVRSAADSRTQIASWDDHDLAPENEDAGGNRLGGFPVSPAPLLPWKPARQRKWRPAASSVDVLSWLIRLERRSEEHEQLLAVVAERAGSRLLQYSQLLDLVVDERILVEVKSLSDDHVEQARAALAQLYHYRFLYRRTLPQAQLLTVFGSRPPAADDDVVTFLDACHIGVAWKTGEGFSGTSRAACMAPWLVCDPLTAS